MAITTYTSGQILTAASLNNNFASGGLQFIKAQTIGSAVSSVNVTGAFSSTYENYLVTINGGVGSAAAALQLKLGSTTTGYYSGRTGVIYSTAAISLNSDNNGSSWANAGRSSLLSLSFNAILQSPNLAKATIISSSWAEALTTGLAGNVNGFLNDSTQYTDFTITPASGTLTGGIIRVYGYANS